MRTKEKSGRWVGVADDAGDCLTYLILTDDTNQCITRSVVRSQSDSKNVNFWAMEPAVSDKDDSELADGEENDSHEIGPHVYTVSDFQKTNSTSNESPEPESEPKQAPLPRFAPDDLIGKTFLKDIENGQMIRAEVVKKINDLDAQNHQNIKFLLKLGDGDAEEIILYMELNDKIVEMVDDEKS